MHSFSLRLIIAILLLADGFIAGAKYQRGEVLFVLPPLPDDGPSSSIQWNAF